MPGESWRRIVQCGKEVTEGTPVAATRKLYVTAGATRQQAPNLIKVSTGTRDNQRDVKLRTVQAMGTVDSPISSDEMLEYFLATLQGGVTPTALATLPGPAAPGAATPSTTGGSLAAGAYTLAYTVTNAVGESPASGTITATTTGATSSIATPVIAAPGGTVKWYMSPPGGATVLYTGLSNATGASVTITTVPTSNATAPASVNTGAYRWQFRPGLTLDTHTYEWFDGYNPWQARGAKYEELKFTGDPKADTKMTGTWWSRDLVTTNDPLTPFTAMTPSLPDRSVNFHQGYAVQLYLDPFGSPPGTTLVQGAFVQWDLTIKNNMARKYFGDNTTAAGNVILGELMVQASITLEGNATGLAEYANWKGTQRRIARIVIGNAAVDPAIGTSVFKPQTWLDIPGAWTAVDLSPESDGSKAFKFSLDYIYDSVNAFGVQATVITSRPTAY